MSVQLRYLIFWLQALAVRLGNGPVAFSVAGVDPARNPANSLTRWVFGDVVDYVYLPPNFSKYYALLVLSLLMERICIENSFQSRSSKNSLPPRV